ncbi:MAG: Fe-S cluster assembly protein SufD [Bacteroidales bacterium]|nr:Fe-S cluster assembly protein SufD [Bacteroidales bacterium]
MKDKLIASFMAFENKGSVQTDTEFHKVRATAMQQFENVGFPTKKNEDWKYTSLKKLLRNDYSLFPQLPKHEIQLSEIDTYFLKGIDSYKIVFVDGVYSPFLSETTHDGMEICLLSNAINKLKYKIIMEHFFSKAASKSDGLTSLNTAFASEGAFIHIPKNTVLQKPIQIVYFTTESEKDVLLQPRNLIIVDENSQVQIVERHQSLSNKKVLNNTVTEIFANKRAHIDYYKIQNDNHNASLIDSTFIEQKEQSVVAVNTFSFGGDITRNTLSFYQKGKHVNSILNGITMLDGIQHVDNQTNVYHQQPNCESHELYKGIYDGQSTGVFNGKVFVEQVAQKTDAFQQNDNILLTDEACINAKPQLEIFADDVSCSHGCTIGQLDKNALFYMRQRGIPEKEAKALLLYAFTNEVVDKIKIPVLKTLIAKIISQKLGVELGLDL